jgi:hypothetical protein
MRADGSSSAKDDGLVHGDEINRRIELAQTIWRDGGIWDGGNS